MIAIGIYVYMDQMVIQKNLFARFHNMNIIYIHVLHLSEFIFIKIIFFLQIRDFTIILNLIFLRKTNEQTIIHSQYSI